MFAIFKSAAEIADRGDGSKLNPVQNNLEKDFLFFKKKQKQKKDGLL